VPGPIPSIPEVTLADVPLEEATPTSPADPSPPELDEARAGVALQAVVELVGSFSTEELFAFYYELWTHWDGVCPSFVYGTSVYDYTFYDLCETAAGTYWEGYGTHAYAIEADYVYDELSATVLVGDVDQSRYNVDGYFLREVDQRGASVVVRDIARGALSWGGEATTPWMVAEVTPGLAATRRIDDGAVTTEVDGTLADLPDPHFDTAELFDVALAPGCAEPTGAVALRSRDREWFEVAFAAPASCDGCGEATWLGIPVGTVCADFSPWTRWEAP